MAAIDTRKYSTPRLPSDYGYEEIPVVDDSLPSRLPLLTRRTGRLIPMGNELCEIWSPNSDIHPYLPGVVPEDYDFKIPDNPRHRRYDGHLGRFDYTVTPQMFSEDRPWRGFIRRPFCLQAGNYTEFAVIHQLWKPHPSSPNEWPQSLPMSYIKDLKNRVTELSTLSQGNLRIVDDRMDVWKNRPVLPTDAEIDRLATIDEFDTAVDLVLEVQRCIRDYDAWHRYVQLSLNNFPEGTDEDWLRNPQPPADDELLGAWVNGALECEVLRALFWRMPCFIAHVLTPEERSAVRDDDRPASRIGGTDVTSLEASVNGYDFIANRSKRGETSGVRMVRAKRPYLLPKHRALSASAAHGWTGKWHSNVSDSQKHLALYPAPPLPPMPGQLYSPLLPAPEALPLDTKVIDEARVPWIRPPPVMKAKTTGKTTHWIEGSVKHKDGMREVAKSASLQHLIPVYDRERKRTLYFESKLQCPPGAVSDEIFGLPLPPLLFMDIYGFEAPRSTWVYWQDRASKGDIGRLAMDPAPSSLPLLSSLSTFPIMGPNDGYDSDTGPDLGDITDILPQYPSSLLAAAPSAVLPTRPDLPPSLKLKVSEAVPTNSLPINRDAPVTVERPFLHQGPPMDKSVMVIDPMASVEVSSLPRNVELYLQASGMGETGERSPVCEEGLVDEPKTTVQLSNQSESTLTQAVQVVDPGHMSSGEFVLEKFISKEESERGLGYGVSLVDKAAMSDLSLSPLPANEVEPPPPQPSPPPDLVDPMQTREVISGGEAFPAERFSPTKAPITARIKHSESEVFRNSEPSRLSALLSPAIDQLSPLHESIADYHEPDPPTVDLAIGSGVHNTTYLRVSSFGSGDDWRTFLGGLRGFASQQGIGIVEVLRSLHEEAAHVAWISLANTNDALCTRGYYMGNTLYGSPLEVHFVDEVTYSAVTDTAVEGWRSRKDSTVPTRPSRPRLQKRGLSKLSRSSSASHHSTSPDSDRQRVNRSPCTNQVTRPPLIKRSRIGISPRREAPPTHIRELQSRDRPYTQTPRHYHRSPSAVHSQGLQPRSHHNMSFSRHDRHSSSALSQERQPRGRYHSPSPQRYRDFSIHGQKFRSRSRGRQHTPSLSPRCYRRSPVRGREFRSRSRGRRHTPSPQRYNHFPSPAHGQRFQPRGYPSPSYRSPPPPADHRRYSYNHNLSNSLPSRFHHHNHPAPMDNQYITYPYAQCYPAYPTFQPDTSMTTNNPLPYNDFPTAAYGSQSMLAFGPHPIPPLYPHPLLPAQHSPPLVPLTSGSSPYSIGGQSAAAAPTHLFGHIDTPYPTYHRKNRRIRGKRGGAIRNENEDQANQMKDQLD